MPMYKCPRCQTMSIPFKDKYRAGMWADIYCSHCKAKLCAYPWLLAGVFVLYAWDVAWFVGVYYYTRNPMNFVYMILVWLIIDALSVSFMPLAVMRRDKPPQS
jgi:hypothetical protein